MQGRLIQSNVLIRGFSLIEIVVVLAMISILTVAVQPYIATQIKKERMISHADQLHRIFKLARSEAVKRNKNITLNENKGNWEVTLGKEILARYSPTHSSIKINSLTDLAITHSGSTSTSEFLVTDNDTDTNDFRLCVYTSGQSILTSNNCP